MKSLVALILAVLFVSSSTFASTKSNERRLKSLASQLTQKIKSQEDVNTKEALLERFVVEFNEEVAKMDPKDSSATEIAETKKLAHKFSKGFAKVQGKDSKQLDLFASYVESELNQAAGITISGPGLLLLILILIILL